MGTCVELYRTLNDSPVSVPDDDAALPEHQPYLQEKIARLRTLGLGEQARLVERNGNIIPEDAYTPSDTFYPRISRADYRIWSWYLPTVYWYLESYKYDIIPDEVLDELEFCKTLGLFQCYAIRTPERPQPTDPILIGEAQPRILGAQHASLYLIARWGESLVPFARIRRRYVLRHPFAALRGY